MNPILFPGDCMAGELVAPRPTVEEGVEGLAVEEVHAAGAASIGDELAAVHGSADARGRQAEVDGGFGRG
jgi:hypothetical protein